MELVRSTSRGGNFVRSILTCVLTVLLSVLLGLLISHSAAAASTAKWDGSSIVYEDDTYKETTATSSTKPTMTSGTKYWHVLEPTPSGGNDHIITFAAGTNVSTATTAEYRVYSVDRSLNYSANPIISSTIPIVPKNTGSSSNSKTAVWENGALIYEGNSYTGQNGSFRTSDGTNPPLASGSKYYQYLSSDSKKAYLLYFSATTDPPTATSAQFISYDISSNAAGNGVNWSNPSTPTTVTIDTSTVGNTTPGGSTPGTSASSCSVENIGWIVCPVSNFLAWGMDNIFKMLEGFLEVAPISTDTNAPLYQAWNVIRNIANVAFVIAFLIIIYAQITSVGLNNYDLKKLLPRLIIAAILVNLSYFICAIAVDLSNVTGAGLEDILVSIREDSITPNTNHIDSWQSVTGYILAAGTATGAATVAIGGIVIASGASLGAALILLLPILLGLILAVLVALLVLAARQALITLLIILAPLAFVAYLLPNTEKLFERWRSIFITMLVFYPLFALIFGGSQLAAYLIIQTAHDINVILLAMFVQVAPLVLTPLLVRFSGGIIGRIAGFVNDPKKGLIDRTRTWAKQESEYMAARNMARRDPVRNRQIFRRFALGMDEQRRTREGRTAAYKSWSDARWSNSQSFSDIDQLNREASDVKTTGEMHSAHRYDTWKQTTPGGRRVDTRLRISQTDHEAAQSGLERQWNQNHSSVVLRARINAETIAKEVATLKQEHEREFAELQTGNVAPRLRAVREINNYANVARAALQRSQIETRSLSSAQSQQQINFANLLANNIEIAREAGGIAEQGAKRAQADAEAVITRGKLETIKAIKDGSSVKAGDVMGMAREIENALNQRDVLTIRAYMDMLSESANPGAEQIRRMASVVESRLTGDDLQEFREHLNASAAINAGLEDVATWSRDTSGRTLRQVTRDVKTYNEMTPMAFSQNKKSTQFGAFAIGAISQTMANSILTNPGARGNLKPSVERALENIRAGRDWRIGVDYTNPDENA